MANERYKDQAIQYVYAISDNNELLERIAKHVAVVNELIMSNNTTLRQARRLSRSLRYSIMRMVSDDLNKSENG